MNLTESVLNTMSKYRRGKLRKYARVKGIGNLCPKCKKPMERRERIYPPDNKTYFYKEWDYCKDCSHIQHYDEYKSEDWKEDERQASFLNSLKDV